MRGDRSDDSIYVSPDIIISASDEGLNVSLCHPFTPHLRISSFCSELKKSSDDPDVLKYVEERISAAGRLYQNVCKYEETLLSCFGKLARLQSAFFYGRTNAFKPMTLADIADSTGLSVSTVSRAMRESIFSAAAASYQPSCFSRQSSRETAVNARPTKRKKYLRQVIDGEDKSAPLSDAQLSDIMTKNGFAISRRTVAKYRDALGIPGTYVRKQS